MVSGVSVPDKKTIITFLTNNTGSFFYKRYDVVNNTWGSLYPIEETKGENLKSSRAILDPKSGLVYLNGNATMFTFNTTAAVAVGASVARDDGGVKTLGMTPIEVGVFKSRLYAGAVYHPQRKSILYFGGFQQGVVFENTAYVTEFVIGTGAWSVLVSGYKCPTLLLFGS